MTMIRNNAHAVNNNGHYAPPAPNPPAAPAHNPHAQAIVNAAAVHHPLPPAAHAPQQPIVLNLRHFSDLIIPAVGFLAICPQAIIPTAAALSAVANRIPGGVVIQLRAPAAPAPVPQGGNAPVAAAHHRSIFPQLRQWINRHF